MPLPRPASPKALIADIRAFMAERSRHQLIAAGFAVLIPVLIIVMFLADANSLKPGEDLVYVQSWSANRTDAEIIAQQKIDQKKKEAAQAERRRQFQQLENTLGM